MFAGHEPPAEPLNGCCSCDDHTQPEKRHEYINTNNTTHSQLSMQAYQHELTFTAVLRHSSFQH